MRTYRHKTYGEFTLVQNFSTGAPPVVHRVELLIDGQALALYMGSCVRNKSGKSKLAHGAIIASYKGLQNPAEPAPKPVLIDSEGHCDICRGPVPHRVCSACNCGKVD